MIASAFVLGAIVLFGEDFSLKEKILGWIFFEVFFALIIFGMYIMI